MRYLAVPITLAAVVFQWLAWEHLPLLPSWTAWIWGPLTAAVFVPRLRWLALVAAPVFLLSLGGRYRLAYEAQALTFVADATLVPWAIWVGVRGAFGPWKDLSRFLVAHGLLQVVIRAFGLLGPANLLVIPLLVPVCSAAMWGHPVGRFTAARRWLGASVVGSFGFCAALVLPPLLGLLAVHFIDHPTLRPLADAKGMGWLGEMPLHVPAVGVPLILLRTANQVVALVMALSMVRDLGSKDQMSSPSASSARSMMNR